MIQHPVRSVKARKILDSKNWFSVETAIRINGQTVTASVPEGTSKGEFEALYLPSSVAVRNVNQKIRPLILKQKKLDLAEFDSKLCALDGTPNKSKLGANATLSSSIAVCKAAAVQQNKPLYRYIAEFSKTRKPVLPVPFMNVLNGGRHAGLEHDIQETMIVPHRFKSFSHAMGAGVAVFHSLQTVLHRKFGLSALTMGDEGGFVPLQTPTIQDRLDILEEAVENAGFSKKISFAIDAAASEFYDSKKNRYFLNNKSKNTKNLKLQKFSPEKLIDFYSDLVRSYKIVSIEDGLSQNDWDSWRQLNKKLGKKIQLVGDDLLVTNPLRIKAAIRKYVCNALLLKPNQIGTVSEAIEAAQLAQKAGWKVQVSHRSAETLDSFVADLAVGIGCGQCKFGAPSKPERLAKYNRLLQIEEELGKKAKFAKF